MTEESSLAIYVNGDGATVDVPLVGGEVWASQAKIAEFFGVDQSRVSRHLKAVFESGELDPESNMRKTHIADNGSAKPTTLYSLDAVISVGYRVSSLEGTRFRTWATRHLTHIATYGYALETTNPDAVENLANRIRQIRLSEAEVFRKVRDVCKESASDYADGGQKVRTFFAMLQDKFHYAVTGKTAAEIILERADATQPSMGMQSFKGDRPTTDDVLIGKNYLTEEELSAFENISEQVLLFSESKAFRKQTMTLEELATKINIIFMANDYPVLYEYKEYIRDRSDAKAKAELKKYLRALPSGE